MFIRQELNVGMKVCDVSHMGNDLTTVVVGTKESQRDRIGAGDCDERWAMHQSGRFMLEYQGIAVITLL